MIKKAEEQSSSILKCRNNAKLSLTDAPSAIKAFEDEMKKKENVIQKDLASIEKERADYIKEKISREKGDKIKPKEDSDAEMEEDEEVNGEESEEEEEVLSQNEEIPIAENQD